MSKNVMQFFKKGISTHLQELEEHGQKLVWDTPSEPQYWSPGYTSVLVHLGCALWSLMLCRKLAQ